LMRAQSFLLDLPIPSEMAWCKASPVPEEILQVSGVMEPTLGAKLLGLLKQIAPNITRVAVLLNPDNRTNMKILALLEADAPRYNVKVVSAPARGVPEIEAAMSDWKKEPNCGVIVPSDPVTNSQRKLVIELAARCRLPIVYALRAAVADGGLISYGIININGSVHVSDYQFLT
jgi:putative tryptophan/tyrosine transport system substrate-binding protein